MRLEFLIEKEGKIINTYDGSEIDLNNEFVVKRFERKNEIFFLKRIIENNLLYKYSVKADGHTVILCVYEGVFADSTRWKEVYSAKATFGEKGIIESSVGDLEYWHEFFATEYGYVPYNESNVEQFSLDDDSMENVRAVFPFNMQTNVFLFFEKYSKLRKIKARSFDKEIFNIPAVKINRNVGKVFDNQYINYAIQREVELANEVFFDITVISGNVKNGVMDIEKKHRYFITEDFAYAPDGGPLVVFVSKNIYGNVYDKNMNQKHPGLMLDKYHGKYYYQYLFAKEFIPCFEILAKAGFGELADMMLDDYYEGKKNWKNINIYGKNDKEIFGFRLNKLKNIDHQIYRAGIRRNGDFNTFINRVIPITNQASYLLDVKDIDEELFSFIERRLAAGVLTKDIEYIKSIGTCNAGCYADYLNMCKETGKFCDGIYPKNLQKAHDAMVAYVNQLRDAKKNKQFEIIVKEDDYLMNLYEDEEYCILAPRVANDLVNESYHLLHCVRTYIQDVATGRTKIYFLREKEKKSKSLVTLEVKSGSIVQARGKCNRLLTNEEKAFVRKWGKEKGLIPVYYGC